MLDMVKHYEYERPTAIQSIGIPSILSGHDMIGIA